jgi:hypothetical protein
MFAKRFKKRELIFNNKKIHLFLPIQTPKSVCSGKAKEACYSFPISQKTE